MVDPGEITESTIKQHYSYQTVGSILYHRVAPNITIQSQILQSDFEYIFESIEARAQALYRAEEHNDRETLQQQFIIALSSRFS